MRVRALLAVVVLGVVPGCARSCTEMAYFDTLTMLAPIATIGGAPAGTSAAFDALPSIPDIASLCVDDRCWEQPFDGSAAPDRARLERMDMGRLVLVLRPGRLPNRVATVRVTMVGGRVYEGSSEPPESVRSPNGKGCGPDQRTMAVTLR